MNDWKNAIALVICCSTISTIASPASADFVGAIPALNDDPDTHDLCTEGNGNSVPGPLTVYSVRAAFDDPADRLLGLGNADLQVYQGADPNVFFQHPFNPTPFPPSLCQLPGIFEMVVCDSFVAIGVMCYWLDATGADPSFDPAEFQFNGHIVGGWFNSNPSNGQGDAGNFLNGEVLFLQSSVAQGLSMSGDIDIFWEDGDTGETVVEEDVSIECPATCACVDEKATICHVPPGKPASASTITVGCNALGGHLAHGDTCGPCQ